jgi:hypothetical protein
MKVKSLIIIMCRTVFFINEAKWLHIWSLRQKTSEPHMMCLDRQETDDTLKQVYPLNFLIEGIIKQEPLGY